MNQFDEAKERYEKRYRKRAFVNVEDEPSEALVVDVTEETKAEIVVKPPKAKTMIHVDINVPGKSFNYSFHANSLMGMIGGQLNYADLKRLLQEALTAKFGTMYDVPRSSESDIPA